MLRAIWILVALCWMDAANAQDLLMERTILMHDAVQGTQMIFLGRSGKTYLWHPSSHQIIPGRWSTRASGSYPDTICLRYGGSNYNPVTGDDEQCTHVQALLAKTSEQAEGDFFGLSARTEAPFQLGTRKTTIAALASKAGLDGDPDVVESFGIIRPGEPLPDMGYICDLYGDNETVRLYSFCASR